MMALTLSDFRDDSGGLISFAFPGGYPIIYHTRGGMIVCPDCANKDPEEWSDPVHSYGGPSEALSYILGGATWLDANEYGEAV